ncbi:hypothetical protein GYMLUDRAFT_245638 [Collybiopsis luxurians FD-317 M1]|uniref:Uncharacterized protein n=1 Tax=Collybiopsis luxurians FD-317 M1 TaxID=944289 RepID=A0A0D0CT02_9AGAR|nr:hypothetical protein GYMLUDRAFT_245638 [Collybiopsis luxurians FD-317 M1]
MPNKKLSNASKLLLLLSLWHQFELEGISEPHHDEMELNILNAFSTLLYVGSRSVCHTPVVNAVARGTDGPSFHFYIAMNANPHVSAFTSRSVTPNSERGQHLLLNYAESQYNMLRI